MFTKNRTIAQWLLVFILSVTFRAASGEPEPVPGLRQEVTASGLTKTYNSLGRLVREENTVGGVVEYEHDDLGNAVVRRQQIADGVWAEWRREFSDNNLLLAERGPEDQEKRYVRGDDGFTRCVVERVDDERWSGMFYDYDENYNIVFQSIPVWVTDLDDRLAAKPTEGVRYLYNETGDLLEYTDPLGHVRRFVYDDGDRLIGCISPTEAATQYEYNEYGWLSRQTDPVGGVTEYEYDEDGNIIAVRPGLDAEGRKSFSFYERLDPDEYGWKAGKNVSYTDPTGRTTRYRYNAQGNITELIQPGGLKSEAVYDDDGRLLAVFRPDGSKSSLRYDASGRLTAAIDASGNRTEYVRDLRGRVTGTVYPGGAEERVEWDAAGRMTSHSQKITTDTWHTTRYEYDRRGETVAIIYPNGTRKTFERDAAGRVVRTVIDPGGLNIIESCTYDLVGNLTAVTDPLGHTSRYSYDEDGTSSASIPPGGDISPFGMTPQVGWEKG